MMDYSARLDRLRAIGQERQLDAVALVPGANLVYFTGLHFHLSERPVIGLVLSGGGTAFIVPHLEYTKLAAHADDLDLRHSFRWTDGDGYEGAFAAAAAALGLRGAVLGVDDMTMRVFEWLAFSQNAPGLHIAGAGQDLLRLRAIKTADEIALMRRAVQLSEQALRETLSQVQPGQSERAVMNILTERLKANGTDALSFNPIVLAGPKSALPHGTPGEREVAAGEFLLFDFGGMVGGYPADITRTFCVGEPSAEMQAMYNAVLAANTAAREAVRPGVTTGEIDQIARKTIADAGYGDYFTHRTGHGLGLEVHELPNITPGDDTVLAPGMVFTIEPGLYVPEIGGVRIEDNVAVTEDGADVLTSFPRELQQL